MAHIIRYMQVSHPRFSTTTKEMLAYGLSLLFVILFLYTVYHKAVAVDAFARGIAKIPLVGTYSVEVAWGVLGAETLVALLLIWPDTNRLALWGALGLMVIFTVYIGATLLFVEKIPCHCGGAIEKLTWGQHLLFNCGFMALAAGLLLYHYKVDVKHKIFTAMKAINSKIKKAIFGMMVAVLTVGFSVYSVHAQRSAKKLEGRIFVNVNGHYEERQSVTDDCLPGGNELCIIVTNDTEAESQFEYDNIPEDAAPYMDSQKGTYEGDL